MGQPLPGVPLILLIVAAVSLLQLPANYILVSVSKNAGIVLNEIVVILLLPVSLLYFLGFDIFKVLVFRRTKNAVLVSAMILSVPVAMLIDYAASASELAFPLPQRYRDIMEGIMAYSGAAGFIVKYFILCVLPGFCEEIFFRGVCQTSLEARWGKNAAIFVTAALFAILHGNPWYIHLYFLLGLFLSWVYAESGTLWAPIICHLVNNSWTFANHALRIEYPLKGFGSSVDIAIILGGIVLAGAAYASFKHFIRREKMYGLKRA